MIPVYLPQFYKRIYTYPLLILAPLRRHGSRRSSLQKPRLFSPFCKVKCLSGINECSFIFPSFYKMIEYFLLLDTSSR